MIKISIQHEDFDLKDEIASIERDNSIDGATVTFVGRVRNHNEGHKVSALFLEHYPGMTEKSLEKIVRQAKSRWNIGNVSIIHRVGRLVIGEQIVFVGVTSKHRKEAFAANEFIMDYLKVSAPFWKKEETDQGERWISAKDSDQQKAQSW